MICFNTSILKVDNLMMLSALPNSGSSLSKNILCIRE